MSPVMAQAGDGVNELALVIFAVVLAITLIVTFWAARRTHTATEFFAAGRGISGTQNGLAIAGDYISAATFLGITGIVFLAGFDGWIIALAAGFAFVPVLLVVAERMRNLGKFTIADVLSFRLKARPVRAAVALTTLFIVFIYLMAQMVGSGVLIENLTGVNFNVSVIATVAFMLIYVVFGGMLATTWVQIIKAVLLMSCGVVMTFLVLERFGFDPLSLFTGAAEQHSLGEAMLAPGGTGQSAPALISTALAFVLGTAGLPHVLMRFFTVPDAQAARKSVWVAVLFAGVFFILVAFIGYGSRAVLGEELGVPAAEEAVGSGGNLAAPLLARELGGGEGSVGGDLFLAIVSAVAVATILAVVAGLVIAASAAVTHDLWSNVIRHAVDSEHEEPRVARIATIAIALIALALTLLGGPGFNVAFLAGLAFSVAASTNFPCLIYSFFWRRFNTAGALTAIGFGLTSAIVLIILSPPVWPGPASEGSPVELTYPALISIPLGFLGGWIGTTLSKPEPTEQQKYYEMLVRSETGIGAEHAVVH
jgi:cation/acetate symporter